jgi:3-methyl-2-oxobutanoate hydroxymethyltransferase
MKISIDILRARKKTGPPVVMLTSYDYPMAVLEDEAGIDIQLVGDSVGTNVLGYEDVSMVSMADMVHHVRAVSRGSRHSFVLCDMPYKSFDTPEQALHNARILLENGANGVKIEGEAEALEQVRTVSASGIAVCAHIGYTPQTDGAKASVQGKDFERARNLITIALELQKAGASLMVLELIPEILSARITDLLSIPTIGIGAGRYCDGQVQVIHDILGLTSRVFRHAKAYGDFRGAFRGAVSAYADDVRRGVFPSEKNAASIDPEVYSHVLEWISRHAPLEAVRINPGGGRNEL